MVGTTAALLISSAVIAAGLPVGARSLGGIEVGRSALMDVQAKIGAGAVMHSGDATASEESVCYQDGIVVVRFFSDSEMATGGGISSVSLEQSPNASGCGAWPGTIPPVFSNGLKVGMTRDEVEKILGKAPDVQGPEWKYATAFQKPLAQNDPVYEKWKAEKRACSEGNEPFVNVTDTISIFFLNGKTSMIEVSRAKSIC